MSKIMIDKRVEKNLEYINLHENKIFSVKMKDIEDVFWFDSECELSDFINQQARERYYDNSLRKGYFEYKNEYGEIIKYIIQSVNRGNIICND